jgi:hypothetical protein
MLFGAANHGILHDHAMTADHDRAALIRQHGGQFK